MFNLRNRFKKSASQQSTYNLNIRAKKSYLNDCVFPPEFYNPNLNYTNPQPNQPSEFNQAQQPNYNWQQNNNLNYDNLESIVGNDNRYSNYYLDNDHESLNENEHSDHFLDDDYESFNGNEYNDHFLDSDHESLNENDYDNNNYLENMPKTFDGTKSNLNCNEYPFSFFKNFTNMAMFIWVTKYMICMYYFFYI